MTTEVDPELKGWLLDFVKSASRPVSLETVAREFFEGNAVAARRHLVELKREGQVLSVSHRGVWCWISGVATPSSPREDGNS
ncbi:hypothetical protein ACFWIB_16990 [Streptomyces sp. NPDC127051]|uniref:hypothetical protein n=1 Tax=Streptomyces sp. NPDC127051 TaxID=3347119 RepID=UPI00365D4929